MKQDYAHARTYMDKVVNPERSDEELLSDKALMGNLIEHAGDIYAHNEDLEQAVGFWKRALEQKTTDKILARKIKRKKYIKQ